MWKQQWRLMSPDDPGAGGGGGAPSLTDPPPADPGTGGGGGGNPPPSNPQSIWGDRKVQWPEGFEDAMKEERSLEPFVDKDGKFNFANVLKSYVSTKKAFGANKVAVPGKNATEADWDEFWKTTTGWSSDINEYKVEKGQDSQIDDEFLKEFSAAAHAARVPTSAAQKLLAFIEGTSKKEIEAETKARQEYLKQGAENLKKDWGEAYNRKVTTAVKAFKELPEDQQKFIKDKGLENDPAMIRIFAGLGEKLFREGRVPGNGGGDGGPMTPDEIQSEINNIMGDPKHPYNNPNHPNFQQAQADMLKLYQRQEKILQG